MISAQVAYVRQTAASIQLRLPTSMVTIEAELSQELADDTVYFTIVDARQIQIIKRYCPNLSLSQNTMSLRCTVQFVLRHQHFASFHKSLDNLQPHVISKLVPRSADLESSLKQIGYLPKPKIESLDLDSEYQLIALKKVLGCSSNAIFLVTGPFGTGKTRLLATAAYNFLKIPQARVLICTCHTQSADAYINDYFGPMVDRRILKRNVLLRLIGKNNPKSHVKSSYLWCVKSSADTRLEEQLVVTTFISTQQLKGASYTHILIDEGAQGREPEAVAPLSLADKHTKIVVAGDHLQVCMYIYAAALMTFMPFICTYIYIFHFLPLMYINMYNIIIVLNMRDPAYIYFYVLYSRMVKMKYILNKYACI